MNTEFVSENGESSGQISSLGPRLKHARETLGLTITDVARRLRLTNERIESLENDDYQNMPGATFVKGYLRSYARLVNLVPDDLIADFNRLNLMPETQPFILSPRKSSSIPLGQKSFRRIVYVGVIGLLILIAIWWNSLINSDPGSLNLDATGKRQPTNNIVGSARSTVTNTAANTASSATMTGNVPKHNMQESNVQGSFSNSSDKLETLKNTPPQTEAARSAGGGNNMPNIGEDQKKSAVPSAESSSANAAADSLETNSASAMKRDQKAVEDDGDDETTVKAHKKRVRRPPAEIDESFDE